MGKSILKVEYLEIVEMSKPLFGVYSFFYSVLREYVVKKWVKILGLCVGYFIMWSCNGKWSNRQKNLKRMKIKHG